MIYCSNVDEVIGAVDAWAKAAERKAELKLKVIAAHALRWLSTHSPQFSGDFAANWRVSVNGVDTSFVSDALGQSGLTVGKFGHLERANVHKQGDVEAINYAFSHGGPVINQAHLGDYITIANSAKHDTSYAWKIENNFIKFRPENAEGGRVIDRFVESFRSLHQ